MPALYLLLLAAAWAGDGLLRRFVDPDLQRHALCDGGAHAVAGLVLLACAVELAVPLPIALARAALHALALVLVGFALAPVDGVTPESATSLTTLRETAPIVDALALALLAGWLLAPPGELLPGAMRLTAWTGILVFVRMLAPPLDARLAVSGSGRRRHWTRLASALLLSLSLLGARDWLP